MIYHKILKTYKNAYEYEGPVGGEYDGGPSILFHFDAFPKSTDIIDSNGIASNITTMYDARIAYENSKFGTSLNFTNSGGWVVFDTPEYNWKQGIQCQFEMWCYTKNNTYPVIMFLQKTGSGTPPWYIHSYSGNVIFADRLGNILISVPNDKFPLNKYFHFAFSNDGTNLRIFVDGVMVGKASTPADMYGNLDQIRLGYRGENIIVYTLGNYDEFKFRYNTCVYNSDLGFIPQQYPFTN